MWRAVRQERTTFWKEKIAMDKSIEEMLSELMQHDFAQNYTDIREMLGAAKSATEEGQFAYAYWIIRGFLTGSDFASPEILSGPLGDFRRELLPVSLEIHRLA